jgi:Undecaprenyl-phosphate galactose phosphotransferase WbaP
MSGLVSVVPGIGEFGRSSRRNLLPSRASSRSRVRQVVLTSIPLVSADFLAIAGSVFLAALLVSLLASVQLTDIISQLVTVGLVYLVIGLSKGLFPATGESPVLELRKLLLTGGLSFLIQAVTYSITGRLTAGGSIVMCVAALLFVFLAPVSRFSTRRICSSFRWWGEPVVVIGAGPQGLALYSFLARLPQRGLRPLGVVDDSPEKYWQMVDAGRDIVYLGRTEELVDICRANECHWVFADVSQSTSEEMQQILNCGSLIPNLVVLNSNVMLPTLGTECFEAAGLPAVHIRDHLLFPAQRLIKRLVDIALSAILIAVATPLMFGIGLVIRLKSPGPVLYRHQGRIGRNGVRFGALKIRTMVNDSQRVLEEYLRSSPEARAEWEATQKLRNDPRIIPGIGHFLRRTSLDELPQLWNVLVGDMSLVGPRPIVAAEIEKYHRVYPLYLRVRPGLTGLWQVSGRNNTSYEDRVRLDSYYVRNWSLWLDYFLLLRTVRTVVFREGSY